MKKLWVQFSLAFVVVNLTAITIVAFFANYQVSTQFSRFVMESQIMSNLEPLLIDHYTATGSWAGIAPLLRDWQAEYNQPSFSGGMSMMGRGGGQGMHMMGSGPELTLATAKGQIIYGGNNRMLTAIELEAAVPLIAPQTEQTIGYLLLQPGSWRISAAAQTFINQTNRSLIQVALLAGALSLLTGILLAHRLSAPLGKLATASQNIAQGNLSQRVSATGAEEITRLATAFNEMAANLEKAETLRRNLVADVAHELRTPLSVIQGNLQAILDDVYPLTKAEIASLYEESLTLNRLIKDLRDLSQAEAGQLSLSMAAVDLPSLLHTTVDLFAELAAEKSITLQLELPEPLPPVHADEDRVRQVLTNLLSNAIRHTPAEGQITVAATPDNDMVCLTVQDTGTGITPQDLPYVFNRFWRADKSRAREQGGTGLGLAISQQLVQAHGGKIDVESKPNQGSSFWFTLPYYAKDD